MTPYIIGTGIFLPGMPVSNDVLEERLGMVAGKPSRFRQGILNANGVITRHFALDDQGKPTMLNSEIAASAVSDLLERTQINWLDVGMLGVGTTLPDIGPPGFDVMVHSEISETHGRKPMETIACQGVCLSAIRAFKACVNSIRLGEIKQAVSVGSERPSAIIRSIFYEAEYQRSWELTKRIPGYRFLHADFLRWTLSDGAGAFLLSNKPVNNSLCLRIDNIAITSYADQTPICMYAQTNSPANLRPDTIAFGTANPLDAIGDGMFVLRQDPKILNGYIFDICAKDLKEKISSGIITTDVDHFVAHYSSEILKSRFADAYSQFDINLPDEIWRSSLRARGNMGSASIFISLHDLIQAGKIKSGDKLLLMIPESARFSIAYVNLTAL